MACMGPHVWVGTRIFRFGSPYARGAVHGLHRRVREERHFVCPLENADRDLRWTCPVSSITSPCWSRPSRARRNISAELKSWSGPAEAMDLQRAPTLHRRPCRVGEHGDPPGDPLSRRASEPNDLLDARDGVRASIADARDSTVVFRTARHTRNKHARNSHVDTRISRSVDLPECHGAPARYPRDDMSQDLSAERCRAAAGIDAARRQRVPTTARWTPDVQRNQGRAAFANRYFPLGRTGLRTGNVTRRCARFASGCPHASSTVLPPVRVGYAADAALCSMTTALAGCRVPRQRSSAARS